MREPKHETRAKKAKLAISYITCGTLMVVWSLIWLLYLTVPADIAGSIYIASGVVLSGIAVMLIGIKVGEIGKEANRDEEEHEEAEEPVARPPQTETESERVVATTPVSRNPDPAMRRTSGY